MYIQLGVKYLPIIGRVSSFRGPKLIHDIMDDHIIQVPCQEPSTSSKYEHQRKVILDKFPIILPKSFDEYCFQWIFSHVGYVNTIKLRGKN